jgi:hypothetical protein
MHELQSRKIIALVVKTYRPLRSVRYYKDGTYCRQRIELKRLLLKIIHEII